MNIRFHNSAILVVLSLTIIGCSSMQSARHEYLMRGQVVEVAANEVVVCVGSKDGARAGQELTAYKLVSTGVGGPARNPPGWEKVNVGSVRIVEVIDEHFARASIVGGQMEVNYIVELER